MFLERSFGCGWKSRDLCSATSGGFVVYQLRAAWLGTCLDWMCISLIRYTEFKLHFGCHGVDIGRTDQSLVTQIRRKQQPVAKRIDAPRHTAAAGMDLRKGRGIEMRVIAPAYMPQPVLDLGPRLFDIERPEVIGRNHTLLELAHFGALQNPAKLWLPN